MEKAELYEITMPLLQAMYREFKELSKKKPEGAVGKVKIKVVNRLWTKCQEVLEAEASIDYLDVLDEDDVPQNSDVVLTLSQYVAAMQQFQSTYYKYNEWTTA
jgi:hypothetical protein